ncbi:MAG: hypothetical protein U1F16_01260 [Turneriella sp.]
MQNSKRILFAVAITLLSSCSERSNITVINQNDFRIPADATRIEAQVTTDAGATLSLGNKLQLTIPAGALSEDALISTETKSLAPVQNELVPIASSIELGGHGLEFNKPVTLNACYDPAKLVQNNLHEDTVAVYYVDPQTGEYASVAGSVNKNTHCVSAQLEHFSVYIIAAQGLALANSAPQISAATFLPATPMAGLPLKIRSVIRDFQNVTVNGQVGFGQVASATLYYRIPGEPSYTAVSLTPDYLDDTATRFVYKIPANRVTTAGIQYYISAVDNLGAPRTRAPVTLAVARTATGIALQTNAVIDLSAGFKRSFTVRGIDDLGTARNIDVDSFSLSNGIGTAVKISASVVQVTGTTTDNQNYRIGNLTVNAGPYSITSADIRVHAGVLDNIAFLSPRGVKILGSIDVGASASYDFTVLGFDAFGNSTNVLPVLSLSPSVGAGSISASGVYTAPNTPQSATLTAQLAGHEATIILRIQPNDSLAWIKGSISGNAYTKFAKIIPDNHDNYVIGGYVGGGYGTTTTFGSTVSLTNMTQAEQPFLVKYDFLGNAVWSRIVYGNVANLKADAQGNIYHGTWFAGPLAGGQNTYTIDPGVAITGLTKSYHFALIKYNPQGTAMWANRIDSTDPNAVTSIGAIANDHVNNTIVLGDHSMAADLDYGQGFNLPALSPTASHSFFLAKYDSTGLPVWIRRQLVSDCAINTTGLTTDSLNDIYIIGYISTIGNCDFGNGVTISNTISGLSGIVVKYSAAGDALWVRMGNIVTNSSSVLQHNSFRAVIADGTNNIFVIGSQCGGKTIDYGNGVLLTGSFVNGANYSSNGVLLKLNSAGSTLWGKIVATGPADLSLGSIAIDNSGDLYISANQRGNAAFDYGAGITYSGTAPSPNYNGLVLKMDGSGTSLWGRGVAGGVSLASFAEIIIDSGDQILVVGYKANNETLFFGPGLPFSGASAGNNGFFMRYMP